GLLFSVPVRNREAKSQYAAARLRKEQSVVNYELLRQGAIKEVRSAVRQIETNQKRVKAARVNKRLQSEKLNAEEKKYENGMSTSFQVLEFQEDLAEAERGEIRAVIDFNLSLAELEKVKGTLGDYRGVVIE
ncbi:MAG: TolC family protein, partial [Acidobacteriota bacterium]